MSDAIDIDDDLAFQQARPHNKKLSELAEKYFPATHLTLILDEVFGIVYQGHEGWMLPIVFIVINGWELGNIPMSPANKGILWHRIGYRQVPKLSTLYVNSVFEDMPEVAEMLAKEKARVVTDGMQEMRLLVGYTDMGFHKAQLPHNVLTSAVVDETNGVALGRYHP